MAKPIRSAPCHPDRKHYAKEMCEPCYGKVNNRRRYLEDPQKTTDQVARWRVENEEHFKRSRRDINFRQRYGITLDERDAMLIAQDGLCAICREVPEKPCVDHDHSTGKVRAIICDACNVGLGRFRDSVELLLSAVAYLQNHG